MMVFLDFDGVLHPFGDRHGRRYSDLPRLEEVLRLGSDVPVVITSTERENLPLDALRQPFSPDIAARIVGQTPVLVPASATELAGIRYREILQFLEDHPTQHWIALDDDESLFPPDFPNLILCENGFDQRAAAQLESVLRAAAKRSGGGLSSTVCAPVTEDP
ncbi:hypothetical protein BG61_29525 [Caballeronia glathei]|uniref:HAD family hydrolase n=1 Tax=Caballeronia glathei TaxID=60547 RepID=A0A069PIU7_9BURK|nr:hypothetical protein BG61_29525 [Caballeronia glathei]